MSLVPEPNASPVLQYEVPFKGTWKSAAAHQIPLDALYDSLNVFIREGKLRNRAGLSLLNGIIFDGPILGAAMAVTPFDKRVLAITQRYLYELGENDAVWVAREPSMTFGNRPDHLIDISFIETSSIYVALIAQENFALKQWGATLGPLEIGPSEGAIPYAKSVCVVGRRAIVLVAPHTVRWSKVFDYSAWPANNVNRLAQTGDLGICVRSLSSLSFALYKERSIHIARSQAGSDALAFAFAEPIMVEGPAGVHAVVNVGGNHVYMTKNGRIAMFNGTSYPQWVADGVWLYLQRDINPVMAHTIFGVYDFRLSTVTFYYPRGNSSNLTGMVILSLPLNTPDSTGTIATFLGVSGIPVSYGCEMRFNNAIDRSLLFSSTLYDCQSFIASEDTNTDDEVAFPCMFQTGLSPMPQGIHSAPSFEAFLERAEGYGTVRVEPVVSNSLETQGGTVPSMKERVLSLQYDPVREYKAFDIKPLRFFGLRYSWDSINTVRYAGTTVFVRGIA